jgi:esterase/lipase superfamily enzyme
MPDGGSDGFFSDWVGRPAGATGPAPAYSTYFMDELIPWIDGHYRTRPTRTGRAIAGLSMGGFGAMSFAARYPDRFVVAGSFSGAVDTELDYPHHTNGLSQGYTNVCMWGNPITNVLAWRAVDPTYLAPNLASVSLYLASGNGQPGDLSFGAPSHHSTVEALIWQMNRRFAAALHAARVPFRAYFYGQGAHSWRYWLRDLRHFLPLMEHAFRHPPPSPPRVAFSYRSASKTTEIWGWTFAIARRSRRFTYFTDVSKRGLTVTGQGLLTVTTAPLYKAHRSYTITLRGTPPRQVRSSRHERLKFTVDLGQAQRRSATITVRISPTNHQLPQARP